MRISRNLKRIGNFAVGLFFFLLCMFGSFITFESSNMDLKKLDIYTGVIIEKGITDSYSTVAGRGKLKSKVFYFKLNGLDQILACYNPKKEYGELDNKLMIGDTIKVYFNRSTNSTKPNSETYQIEKKDLIILDANDYKFREKIAGYMALVGAFVMIGITVYQDKKYWKKK